MTQPTSPTSSTTSREMQASNNDSIASGGRQGSQTSYTGNLWTMYFNGKSAIAEAFRRDAKLRANVPAYVLGRQHSDTPEYVTQWLNINVKHIHYFSYRNRLPEPLSNGLDHDAGWGCMIRTGQMMLCEALKRCLPVSVACNAQRFFYDLPSAPFGLHAMTQVGASVAHIPVGQWFSPTGLAYTLRRLVADCPVTSAVLGVVVAQDGAVRRDDITSEFLEGRFVLLMIPIMAGRNSVPADVRRAILKTFELERTLGIVGGRPKHSLYFVGCQAEQVFYLDPHTVQPAFVSPETVGNASGVRGTMPVADLDPSMVMCFLLTRNRDLEQWETFFATEVNPLTEYPLFSVIQRKGAAAAPAGAQAAAAGRAQPPPPRPTVAAHEEDDVVDDCAFDDED